MVAHAHDIDRQIGADGLTAGLHRAWDLTVEELEAIERGFFAHDYPGKLFMLLLVTVATMLTSLGLMILAGAVLRAEHAVLVALLAVTCAFPACGAWSFLRAFARFQRIARAVALLFAGEFLVIGVFAWLTVWGSVMTGLVVTSWVALAAQLFIYLIRDGERWVE